MMLKSDLLRLITNEPPRNFIGLRGRNSIQTRNNASYCENGISRELTYVTVVGVCICGMLSWLIGFSHQHRGRHKSG